MERKRVREDISAPVSAAHELRDKKPNYVLPVLFGDNIWFTHSRTLPGLKTSKGHLADTPLRYYLYKNPPEI